MKKLHVVKLIPIFGAEARKDADWKSVIFTDEARPCAQLTLVVLAVQDCRATR